MSHDYLFNPQIAAVPIRGRKELFPVRRIYCVGRNYLEHIREMGGNERELPFFFQKPADAIVLDKSLIAYPVGTQDFQHEVELVLAIRRGGRDISPNDAAGHVFGLAVGIDLTRRDLQLQARNSGRPWESGKAFDRSAVCSEIAPLTDAGLPLAGRIELLVNGDLRQGGDLKQMIWNSAEIVSQLSRLYELIPGDLVYTGTPSGVGPIVAGDKVLARIKNLATVQIVIGAGDRK